VLESGKNIIVSGYMLGKSSEEKASSDVAILRSGTWLL